MKKMLNGIQKKEMKDEVLDYSLFLGCGSKW